MPPPRSFAFTAATRPAGTSTFTTSLADPATAAYTNFLWRSLHWSRLATSRRR